MKKIPVILQMEAVECGAASLAMILAYYGRYVPLEKLRLDCGVSRDGSNAMNLYKAAQYYGLNPEAYSREPDDLDDLQLPAIIHWNFNHFVVLCGFKKNGVVINDPDIGRTVVTYDEFDKSFTGVILCFEKGDNFEAKGSKKSVFKYISEKIKVSTEAFSFIVLTGFILMAMNVVRPIFSMVFIDEMLNNHIYEKYVGLMIAMLVSLGITVVFSAMKSKYLLKFQAKLAAISNAEFMLHVLSLPIEFFAQRHAGDIASRQADNSEVARLLCEKVAPVFINVVMIVFYLAVMLKYDLALSLLGIISGILNVIMFLGITSYRKNLVMAAQKEEGKFVGILASELEIIETIKSSGSEDCIFEKWAGMSAEKSNKINASNCIRITAEYIPQLLISFTNALILLIGIYKVLTGEFTIGMIIAFQGFVMEFLNPVDEVVSVGGDIERMHSSMDRIDDVMNYKKDIDIEKSNEKEFANLTGNVEIKNLSFSYSTLGSLTIHDFSMKLEAGKTVALVGGSGSGKSTIAKLLIGLYKNYEGEILFDGKHIDEINRMCFVNCVSMVNQNIKIFKGTVYDNITMWDDSITKDVVIKATKDACIYDDIMMRKGEFEHEFIENGKNFSGGQLQRIELARAFVLNPKLMILDEATSALDTDTEYKIMQNIKQRGISCIIVAHRLSTIRDCDEIIVLEKGQAVQRGTHKELVKQDGYYKRLINVI